MSLEIKSNNWGEARINDLQKVLMSAKGILDSVIGYNPDYKIWVYQNLERGVPFTLYERGPNGEYKIELNTTDNKWSQCAYQFSHEYCHVRTNYNIGLKSCKWFEESICELASIYTLIKMSDEWSENPLYESWKDYSTSLFHYAEGIINSPENQLQTGENFIDWFESTLPRLYENSCLRDCNAIIAIKLLPLFQETPELWTSMKYWNTWKIDINDDIYISFEKWINILPENNRSSVRRLIEIFGVGKK